MNEIAKILQQNNPLPIKEICNYFHEQHSKLQFSEQHSFFDLLFSIFSKNSENFTIDEWDRLRLIAFIFVIAFNPPKKSISFKFPKDSKNGYLVSSSFVLLSWHSLTSEFLIYLDEYFLERLDSLFTINPESSFYDINSCYFFLINSHISNEIAIQLSFMDDLYHIFQKVCQLSPEQINYCILLFITDAYQLIKTFLMTKRQVQIPNEFISSFIHLLDLSSNIPDIFLLNFFYTWFYIVKQCNSYLPTDQLLEKLPIITNLFETTSTRKYHELHRLFPWYLIFYFYDFVPIENHEQRKKLLLIICNGIGRLKRIDNFPQVPESVKMFSISLVQQFIDNKPYDLFFILSCLNSTHNSIIFQLKKLHAVSKKIPKIETSKAEKEDNSLPNTKQFKKRQVSFYEQSNWSINSPQIDHYLYSNSFEKTYQNKIECAKDFDRIVHICENIRHHLHTYAIFQIQIYSCCQKVLSTENANTLNLQQYLLNGFSSFIDTVVYTSYKQMEIQSFSTHEVLIGCPVSPHHIPYTQNIQGMLNFNGIFNKYFDDCIFRMPISFIDALAMKVSSNLFVFMKERILTFNFITNFASMMKNYDNPNSFVNLLLTHMMEIASKNIDLILSMDIDDANLFSLWILFTIKMAEPPNGSMNRFFGLLLKTYQKLIVFSVFSNLKSISHQSVAVRMVHFYLEAVDKHFKEIEGCPLNFVSSRIRPVLLENFEKTAVLDGIEVIFDICLNDPEFMPENALLPLIKTAFESKDLELINKASKICLSIFTPERSNKNPITSSIEFEEQIFNYFMKSINFADLETSRKILEVLPYYSSKFLKALSPMKIETFLTIDFKKIEYGLILNFITAHLSNSDEEASHLFALISVCFETIIDQLNQFSTESLKPILTLLICLIKHCSGFNHLKEPMNNLLSFITRSFGDSFIKSESNLYILCVLEVIGINRSDSTSTTMNLAISFFNYCSEKVVNSDFLVQTLDSLFTFFPSSTKFFSILSGLSLFIRFYPQFIHLNHIRSLLIQTSEISPLDKGFSSVLNLSLKKFFEKSDTDTLKKFVSIVYEIICPLSISVRNVIEKRLSKLKIPLPISNLDSIEKTTDRIIMFQKLTLAFLCGIEGDLIGCLNQNWIDRIIQFFRPNPNENIHSFQKYICVLSLCLSILRDPIISKFFISNSDFFNNLVRFLCSTLLCNFTPVKECAKKCFKILKKSYYSELMTVKMIDDFLRNPKNLFSFWGPQTEKINFYTKLTKLLPEKVPPELIIDYFIEVENYCRKSDIDKKKLIKNFSIILKQFTIKDYITLQPVKSLILNDSSYLENYIQCILSLYQSSTIPFKSIIKKHVMKFLVLFPDQTVGFIINNSIDQSLFNYYFLFELISDDKSDTFFQSFLHYFDDAHEFDHFSPCLISIFEKLSNIERFAKEKPFFMVVNNGLTQNIHSFSDPMKNEENLLSNLHSFCISYLNILQYHFELANIVNVSSILQLSIFNQTDLYQLLKKAIFDSNKQIVVANIIKGCLKSYLKMPLKMLHFLLPYSIKALSKSFVEEKHSTYFAEIWKKLIEYLNVEGKITPILKGMIYLIDKEIPEKDQLKIILLSIKNFIRSSDTETIIYSLKLSTKLAQLNFLPKEIFEGILKQLFSFSKFFEVPYFSCFLSLIKTCPDYVENLSPKAIETISFFFHDRFINLKDIQKAVTVLVVSTKIYKILPFSILLSISNFLRNKLKTIEDKVEQSKNELIEIREILAFIIPLFNQIETNSNEKKILHKTCFKYMKIVLNSSNHHLINGSQCIEFNESFYNLLLKSDFDFPKNILNLLNKSVSDQIKFALVCIAAHFDPEILITEFPELIGSTLEFIKNENARISKTFLQTFMKFIFDPTQSSSKSIYIHFQIQIQILLNYLLEHLTVQTIDNFFIVASSFVSAHYDPTFSEFIDKIFSFYSQIDKDEKLSILLFQLILNLIGFVPVEDQLVYIDIVIKQEWNLSMKNQFTKILPSLISCPNILNKGKKKLISLFPTHVYGTETELLKIIHTVKIFGEESGYDVLGTLILLYILIASNSPPVTLFLCFEKIDELLRFTFKEKFTTLLQILPINLWSDDYFIYIIAILAEKNKFYYPLFAFSHRLKKITPSIAYPVLEGKIDDELLNDIKLFFSKNLIGNMKVYYVHFYKTINFFMMRSSTVFQSNLLSKFQEPFPDKFFLPKKGAETLNFTESYLSHFAYPDAYAGSLINDLMMNSTKRQELAVFLSHLCKYESAEKLFIEEGKTTNQYFNIMRKFNNQFLPNYELEFDSIVRPLTKINHQERIITNLKKCIEYIHANNKEKSIEYLKITKDSTIDFYRNIFNPTSYQRVKLVYFSIIQLYIEKFINEGEIPKFNKENLFQCLNPTLVQSVKNFKRFIAKKGPKKTMKISSKESPSILISPSIYSHFKEVSGITPHGLFALNSTQINDFFSETGEKIQSNRFTISNWISFAPFCFNVFIAQQSLDCFSAAYNAYCQIIMSKSDASIIQLNEASARIITLIRIAVNEDEFLKPIIQSSFIFKKEYAKVWHVWLQQLVEIAKNSWFFNIAIELFTEMAYRSTLYASKFASKEIQDALYNAIVNEHSFVQISMMNKIAKILNRINSIPIDELDLQTKIQTFINESLKLNEEQLSTMNLMEIRSHRNFVTPFETALSKLTKSEIEKIGDFNEWISSIRQLNNDEKELKIQEFTNSSKNLSVLSNDLGDVIDEFNEQMPFIFPIRGNELNTEFSIFVIHKNIKLFSSEMVTFSSSTSYSSKQYFLIMSKKPNGFRPSVVSINHFLSLIRSILRNSYSTVARSITLDENYCFEIGSNTILKRLESEPISLKTFFEIDMMITQEDWIKENIEYDSLEKGSKLNEKGKESIKSFPNDSLPIFLKNNYGPKSCIFNPHGIAVSYVSISLMRYIMSAPYPNMNTLIMCARSLQVPVLSIDFNDIKLSEDTPYSNFRFSPVIEHICAIWGDSGLKIAFAAISIALIDNLELLRTHLEVILGDEMLMNNNSDQKFSIDEMLRQRSILENKFIALSPPNYVSNDDEASSWLDRIIDLIEKAKNPWIQPAETIPWY